MGDGLRRRECRVRYYGLETVAVNRSLPIAVFATVADAEKWLLSKVRVDAEWRPRVNNPRPQRLVTRGR